MTLLYRWSKKLNLSEEAPEQERAWLAHELGYCHLEVNELDAARRCGETSHAAAASIPDANAQLNANILIAQAIRQ